MPSGQWRQQPGPEDQCAAERKPRAQIADLSAPQHRTGMRVPYVAACLRRVTAHGVCSTSVRRAGDICVQEGSRHSEVHFERRTALGDTVTGSGCVRAIARAMPVESG